MPLYDDPVPKSTVADWDFSSIEGIEADIAAMEDFAAGLKANLQKNYAPHADAVAEAMFTAVPSGDPFYELHLFMYSHQKVQDATQQNVDLFFEGTHKLAVAAEEVSARYRGSDAFSRATVSDIEAELKKAGGTTQPPGDTYKPSGGDFQPTGEA